MVFSTSGSESDLVYLDDSLFGEPLTAEECRAEYALLTDRMRRRQEELPEGARKANKHYRPWEEMPRAALTSTAQHNITPPPREGQGVGFKGRPYSEIIAEWWKRNGGEPQEGERNVKLYQLAVNLRAICDNNKARLLQVMPRLGLDEREVESIVESACKEQPKGLSKPMREILGCGWA